MTSKDERRQEWYDVRDPEMARMTEAELADYIAEWSANLARYRQEAKVWTGPSKPGEKGPGFSAWWAGKILDRGIRERERRRHHAHQRLAQGMRRLTREEEANGA